MSSGFVTSGGKQWAGQYDCGSTGDYAKDYGGQSKKAADKEVSSSNHPGKKSTTTAYAKKTAEPV